MTDYLLGMMAGIDIPIQELALVIHPPTIADIAYMGENKFFINLQYICLDKYSLIQDEALLKQLTNFQVFMKILEQSKSKKEDIQTLLLLLFPNYSSIILPNGIILNQENQQPVRIDDSNFDIFQECIKQVTCISNIFQNENIIYNPANAAAKKIADKLMAGRRKVAELNNKKNSSGSVLARYLSILEVAKVVSPIEGPKLNLFQLFDLMERYNAFVEWDIDIKVRLAGGESNKDPENWMRDFYSENHDRASDLPSSVEIYK